MREAVWNNAKKDIGLTEGKRNNTGKTQGYAKVWNYYNPKNKLPLNSAYCGLGLYTWFLKTGIETNIAFEPRAIEWQKDCKNPKAFWSMTEEELKALKKSGVVVFKAGRGYHVELFEKYRGYNIYSIGANTSNARSPTIYTQRQEGVFYSKTKINNEDLKPLYYCDVISQSTVFTK